MPHLFLASKMKFFSKGLYPLFQLFLYLFFSLMVISCVLCGSPYVGESPAQQRICVKTRREIHLASPFKMNVQRRRKSDTVNSFELSTKTVLEKRKKLEQDASRDWKARKNVSLVPLHSDEFPLEKESRSGELL